MSIRRISGTVCCLCLSRLTPDDCWRDLAADRWDICVPCGLKESYARLFLLMAGKR